MDTIVGIEYFRLPSELKKIDDESETYRASLNVGLAKSFYFTKNLGVRAQTLFHITITDLLFGNDDSNDSDNPYTHKEDTEDLGCGWSLSAGPVYRIPFSDRDCLELSAMFQNFLGKNYCIKGKYKGGFDSMAVGGEILYRHEPTAPVSDKDFTFGFLCGAGYYWNFRDYFFDSKESFTGRDAGWAIRPILGVITRF